MPDFTVQYNGRSYIVSADRQPTQEEVDGFFQSTPFSPPADVPADGNRISQDPLSFLKDRVLNPDNWGTIGGVLGGIATTPFTGGMGALAAMLTAGGGGAVGAGAGELASQVATSPKDAPLNVDPREVALEAGKNLLYESLGMGVGRGLKRGGASAYASGAGLNRSGFSRNFPTAAQEGLEGGRFTVPIISAAGANRVANRASEVPKELIQEASAKGVVGPTPVEIAARGGKPLLQEAKKGAPFRQDERKWLIDNIKEFIEQWSQVTPASSTKVPYTQYIEGLPVPGHFTVNTPKRVNPLPLTLEQTQGLKMGSANRAQTAMTQSNAEKFPGIGGRLDRGISLGAQKALEDRIPDLADANRRVQGLIGLNQSLNPSFRTTDELVRMGVDPTIAGSMTAASSNNPIYPRLFGDVAAGSMLYGMTGDPWAAAGAGLAAHAAMSPTGRRILGAGSYSLGRATPNLGRAARLGTMTPDEEKAEMMRQAITNALMGGGQ